MSAILVSETRKITTTRMWVLLIGLAALLAIGGSLATAFLGLSSESAHHAKLFEKSDFVASIYSSGSSMARVIAIIAGAMAMGAEYRHKTLPSSVLAVPKRLHLLLGKLIVTIAYGVVFGLVATVAGFLTAIPFIVGKDAEFYLDKAVTWQALTMSVVSLALWTLIGMGLGILVRNLMAAWVTTATALCARAAECSSRWVAGRSAPYRRWPSTISGSYGIATVSLASPR